MADRGVVAWAIASDERNLRDLEDFVDALDIDMPVLIDDGGEVNAQYQLDSAIGSAPYPQNWVIGTDGNIAYVSSRSDVDAMVAVIEAELAGR
jgi:peroxiredoxin